MSPTGRAEWLKRSAERYQREKSLTDAGEPFINYPPEFFDWCALHSQGEQIYEHPVTGQVIPVFWACLNKNADGLCASFETSR